jgi:hypothetical protein
MASFDPHVVAEIVNAVPPELYFLLWKAIVVFFLTVLMAATIKNLAVYVRLRFSDLFSKRTLIIYDGFEGIIEEISITGIFIRNREGVTKFVPLNRWYMGDIRYPNVIDHKDEE